MPSDFNNIINNANGLISPWTASVDADGFNLTDFGALIFRESASVPTTAANQGALYGKDIGSTTQLWWRHESAGLEVQMTNSAELAIYNSVFG